MHTTINQYRNSVISNTYLSTNFPDGQSKNISKDNKIQETALPVIFLESQSKLPGSSAGFFTAMAAYATGGVLVGIGIVLAPTGAGIGLVAAGSAVLTAAPYTLIAPTP